MKVEWTLPAVDDLEAIHEYIGKDSEFYANSFIEKILKTVDILVKFPEIGRKVPEANNPNIRELIFQNYRIIYRIVNDIVQVIGVIRGSRDMTKSIKPWEII